MSYFGKVFKFQSTSENYDEFLNSLGLPTDLLNMLSNFKGNQKIEKSGDNYIYLVDTPTGEKSLSFASGIEFEDKIRDQLIKNTITVNGNCVKHVMKFDSGPTVTINKEYSASKLVKEVTNSKWDGTAYMTYQA